MLLVAPNSPFATMAPAEAGSIPWFIEFMGLLDRGVIPTVTAAELMPNRAPLAELWGLKHGNGFTFRSFGCAEYKEYVRILSLRVLQVPWPVSGAIPFHFAQGLVAEAHGMDVNWAEFAFKMTHQHQSHTGLPRILPKF